MELDIWKAKRMARRAKEAIFVTDEGDAGVAYLRERDTHDIDVVLAVVHSDGSVER